jgi:hypothetical protein
VTAAPSTGRHQPAEHRAPATALDGVSLRDHSGGSRAAVFGVNDGLLAHLIGQAIGGS